jgi:hypothetical protein
VISPGSRYENADRQFTVAHIYSQWEYPLAEVEGNNTRIRTVNRQTTYRVQTGTPPTPQPYEYYVKDTENIQFLAFKFHGDCRRWWEIADDNLKIWYPLDLKMGDFIVIRA